MSIALTIACLATATLCLKATGPVLTGGLTPPPPLERVISLFTPTLIASLIATSTFSANGALLIDERTLGVGAGFIALYFRASHLLAGIIAATTCAVARRLA